MILAEYAFAPHNVSTGASAEDSSPTRYRIANLLERESFTALQAAARSAPRFSLVTRLNGRHVDLDPDGLARLPKAQKEAFRQAVKAEAERGFQYFYETYPVYDKWHQGSLRAEAPGLADLFEWLNGEVFLGAMRDLLAMPDIAFADAQLTRYRAGHFLSTHDDGVEGKNRRAAYTLTLTEGWSKAYGGLLEFYGPDGQAEACFVPQANTLNLFKVPQPHAVTPVGAKVKAERLSITGWLRAGKDPGPG